MQLSQNGAGQRNVSFDILKILASFMVVLYHLGVNLLDFGFDANQFYIPNLNKMCLSFCAMSVPLFFMVNGSLVLGKERSLRYHVVKAVKAVILYVLWLVLIEGVMRLLQRGGILQSSESVASAHLWFLRTLAILYVLGYFIKKCYHNKVIMGIVCGAILLVPFLYNYGVAVAKFFHIAPFESLSRTGLFTMYSIVFYIGGKFLYDRLECFHKKKYALALEILMLVVGWIFVNLEVMLLTNYDKAVFDGVNASFGTPGALLMAFGVYALLGRIRSVSSEKVNKVIGFFSRNMMGIYLLHMPIVIILKGFIQGKMNILPAIVLAIVIMVICAWIAEMIRKISVLKKLFEI